MNFFLTFRIAEPPYIGNYESMHIRHRSVIATIKKTVVNVCEPIEDQFAYRKRENTSVLSEFSNLSQK